MRDTEMLLENTGVGKLCNKHKLRFVDLNIAPLSACQSKIALPDLENFICLRQSLKQMR